MTDKVQDLGLEYHRITDGSFFQKITWSLKPRIHCVYGRSETYRLPYAADI